jgi:hypothetical protein
MDALLRRLLLTACCLVLMLPPGWCRFVSVPTAWGQEEAPKKSHRGCCDCCPRNDPQKPPPGPKQPPPRCCCYGLDWLKPNPPEKARADLALFAFTTPEASASTGVVVRRDFCLSIPGSAPPLYLLKCVWLC